MEAYWIPFCVFLLNIFSFVIISFNTKRNTIFSVITMTGFCLIIQSVTTATCGEFCWPIPLFRFIFLMEKKFIGRVLNIQGKIPKGEGGVCPVVMNLAFIQMVPFYDFGTTNF